MWWLLIPLLLLLLLLFGHHYHIANWGNWWLNSLDGLNRLFAYRLHRLQGTIDHLPPQGGAVLVCNHLSGVDPFLLLAASPRPLRFLMAEEEYSRFGLEWLFRAVGCIPVSRETRPEKAYRKAIKAINSGEIIAIFPQGKIVTDNNFSHLKAGAVRLAQKANAPIIPLYLHGVGAKGEIISAMWRRGYPQLQQTDPIVHTDQEIAILLQEISRFWQQCHETYQ